MVLNPDGPLRAVRTLVSYALVFYLVVAVGAVTTGQWVVVEWLPVVVPTLGIGWGALWFADLVVLRLRPPDEPDGTRPST